MLRVKNMYIKLLPLYVGLALLIASPTYLAHKRDSAVKVAAASAQAKLEATSQTEVSKNISGMPVRIIMPAQLIDLPVVKGYYLSDKKVWYVAPTSATYATNTEPLNNIGGMSLIYGHDYSYVFAKTKSLKPGDSAIVYTDNGHIFQYIFKSEVTVDPTDTQVFSEPQSKPTLKLLTCGGAWYQNRRIMTFQLVKVV